MKSNIDTVRGWVAAAERVVALTGAGISTDSGIPDFRGPQGVWTKNPEAEKQATIQHYVADKDERKRAWRSRLEMFGRKAEPNAGHLALVALERRGKVDTLIRGIVDIGLTVPGLLVLIIIAVSLKGGLTVDQMALVVASLAWLSPTRTIRAQVLSLRERGYVEVARLSGMSGLEIIVENLSKRVDLDPPPVDPDIAKGIRKMLKKAKKGHRALKP